MAKIDPIDNIGTLTFTKGSAANCLGYYFYDVVLTFQYLVTSDITVTLNCMGEMLNVENLIVSKGEQESSTTTFMEYLDSTSIFPTEDNYYYYSLNIVK